MSDWEDVQPTESTSSAPPSQDSDWVDVDAPHNTVYHSSSDRVLGLPQTLNADEAQYSIDKDIDGKKGFAGMVHVGDVPPSSWGWVKDSYAGVAVRSLTEGVVRLPHSLDGITLEQAHKLQEGSLRLEDARKGRGSINAAVRDIFRDEETPEEAKARYDAGVALEQKVRTSQKENEDYIKGSWFDTGDVHGFGKEVMAGLGSSLPGYLSAATASVIMKNPAPAMAYFYESQRSQSYQDAIAAGKTSDEASRIATTIAVPVSALDMVGINMLFKGLKKSGVVSRYVVPLISESVTEGAQQVIQDVDYQVEGVKDQSLEQIAENAVVSALVGGLMAGTGAVAFGHVIKEEMVAKGVPEDKATTIAAGAAANFTGIVGEAHRFIDNEFAPIARDKEEIDTFKTLFQKFVTGQSLDEDVSKLTPEQRVLFDDYVDYFKQASVDDGGVKGVEKAAYERFVAAGVDQEQAHGAARLLGARADAASRALGITPKEWFDSHNLQVQVKRTDEEAKAVYEEKLAAIRGEAPSAEAAAPATDPARAEELASIEAHLKQQRRVSTKADKPKKVLLSWIKRNGGINIDGINAGELRNMGLKVKNAPGLFTKGRGMTLDNIPAVEFNDRFDVVAEEDGNGYVDLAWLFEQIDNEVRGIPMQGKAENRVDDGFLRALEEAGLDINTVTAEQVLNALGPEGDVIAAARAYGERINPEQAREILGIQAEDNLSSIDEAIQKWQERMDIGNFFQGPADGQTVLPGAEKATDKQVAEKGMEGRLKPTKAQKPMDEGMFGDGFKQGTLFQSAFHGSPYNFDQFTLDHIGKGEGAQAYGWGLYFAGNKEVAEYYRATLSKEVLYKLDGTPFVFSEELKNPNIRATFRKSGFDIDATIERAGELMKSLGEETQGHQYAKEDAAVLRGIKDAGGLTEKSGKLYEVDIPEDSELLRWDAPFKEQPVQVREALSSLVKSSQRRMRLNQLMNLHIQEDGVRFDDPEYLKMEKQRDALPKIDISENTQGHVLYNALAEMFSKKREILGNEHAIRDDEAASKYLNELGVKGIKYLDAGSRTANKHGRSHNFVIFDDAAIKILDKLYQGTERAPRGNINFTPDQTLITLFETADPSTLLHELGHLFLRDMRNVSQKSKRPMVARDYRIIKEWLGAKGEFFTVDQEEKFARGFEAYLREGKAPKPELQTIFDKFKDWLTQVYKSVRNLDVKINDDIRQVFDRMLGGDFARSEAAILTRDTAKVAADYIRIAEPPPSTIRGDTSNVLTSGGQLASNIFTPISSRLGRIHPKLKAAVRKYTFQTGLQTQRDREKVLPFLNHLEGMTEEDYRMLDFALKNRDEEMVGKLVKKYKAEEAYKAVTALLDEIYQAADATGMDLGYLQNYFPRMVRLGTANEYLNTLRGTEQWSAIAEAMVNEDPDNLWTDEEKASFVNKYLRGLPPGVANMHKPSFTKGREIDYVEPEHNRFYLQSGEALLQYINSMRLGIAQREVFGKGENSEKSIGAYVATMVKQGVINHEQEAEVKMILGALINSKGPGAFVSWIKNAGYVYTMGSPISALTQLQDLAFSLAKNGFYRTGVSFVKSVTGHQILTKEELGIDNIAREFEDETRASTAVRWVFKRIGLEWMDNIGKETFIDSSFKRLQSQANKNSATFRDYLSNIFGEEAESVRSDLLEGNLSDNVKELLYSELSNFQPVSLAEMPVGYLRGGNWRSLYMLKTYTIKQIDAFRTECFDKMASGNREQVIEGTQMLLRMSTALMLMGMGTDALKDLILGRDIDLSNLAMDNVLKTVGFSKYQIYQAKTDGLANTIMQYLFVPPLYSPVDNALKDISDIIGKENKNTGEVKRMPVKDARTFSYIPGIGKFYYWWYGGGRTKTEKARAKKGKD